MAKRKREFVPDAPIVTNHTVHDDAGHAKGTLNERIGLDDVFNDRRLLLSTFSHPNYRGRALVMTVQPFNRPALSATVPFDAVLDVLYVLAFKHKKARNKKGRT